MSQPSPPAPALHHLPPSPETAGLVSGYSVAPHQYSREAIMLTVVTFITLILILSVLFMHVSLITKLVVDLLLFAGWAFFAIIRTASQRRRARQARNST
jgi:uncharacterized membrane protein YesL